MKGNPNNPVLLTRATVGCGPKRKSRECGQRESKDLVDLRALDLRQQLDIIGVVGAGQDGLLQLPMCKCVYRVGWGQRKSTKQWMRGIASVLWKSFVLSATDLQPVICWLVRQRHLLIARAWAAPPFVSHLVLGNHGITRELHNQRFAQGHIYDTACQLIYNYFHHRLEGRLLGSSGSWRHSSASPCFSNRRSWRFVAANRQAVVTANHWAVVRPTSARPTAGLLPVAVG